MLKWFFISFIFPHPLLLALFLSSAQSFLKKDCAENSFFPIVDLFSSLLSFFKNIYYHMRLVEFFSGYFHHYK